MPAETSLNTADDFEYLLSFLPPGWQVQAKVLGALRRCRKVPDAETLLRVLLIHLADGCSLRETALRARRGKLVTLSDVAIMDRLRRSGEWFRWMNTQLMSLWVTRQPATVFGPVWSVRLVDGTCVKEPGPTGSSWRVHYAIALPSLRCTELRVATPHGQGETFRHFTVQPGELFIGDRAYGTGPGIVHVVEAGGAVLVRFPWNQLELRTGQGAPFDLFAHLRRLHGTQVGDWAVAVPGATRMIPGRVCAIKKSRQAAARARQQVYRRGQKHGVMVKANSVEAASYVFVFTTVPAAQLSAAKVLEFYRGRWQIELVFKRLKSLLDVGHLRKVDPEAARSWIQGKLLVAFLVEVLLRTGDAFFPWGYPLREGPAPEPLPVA